MPGPEHDPSPRESGPRDEASRLRAAFDAAIRDATRFARLLAVLSEPAPQDRLLDRALATLSELFSADIVVLLDPAGTGTYSPLASIGLPEDLAAKPLSDAEDGYVVRAMTGQTPLLTAEVGTDPRVDRQLRDLGAEAIVWLPVTGSRSPRGVLVLARCRPAAFTPADVDLLSTFTYRIGLALEQTQRSVQLTRIERYGRDVGRHLEESAVADEAVRAFPTVLGSDAAALVLEESTGYRCAARSGLDPAWDRALCRLAQRLGSDPAADAATPVVTTDAAGLFAGLSEEAGTSFPGRALLAAPIRRHERAQGYLFALRVDSAAFPPDSQEAAMLFAGQTAAALENARLYKAARAELAERMRAEEERQRLEIQLRQAQRLEAIGTFAGGIAHDYNNLLQAVIGNMELAKENLRRESGPFHTLENAMIAALQAAELTRRFVTFTESGTPVTEATPLRALLMDTVSQALAGSNVRAEYRIPEDLWDPDIDRLQVKQSIGAIVVNAREAMPGGGVVTVTAGNVEQHSGSGATGDASPPARSVMVAIADRGQGISRENLPRIFDPYFSTKSRGEVKGMGLGLAIAHSIIGRHRGRIEVESEPGFGTTVRIYLPASTLQRAPAATVGSGRPHRSGAMRVLLQEDEPRVAAVTIRLLRSLGFHDVEHVVEGGDAVARFTKARDDGTPFRLAILDLTVHNGMGGKETVRKLLEIDANLCAIACSGFASDPVMSRHREYGFRGALAKPFRTLDLARAIEDALAAGP